MSKNSKLLKSILILNGFYFGLGILLFLFSTPHWVYNTLERLPLVYRSRLPALPPIEQINLLDQLPLQLALLSAWTVPLLMSWLIVMLIGVVAVVVYWQAVKYGQSRINAPDEGYRGFKSSVGKTLTPTLPESLPCEVTFPGVKFTAPQKALANEIFSLLYAHQKAFTGDGHGVGLYDHTMRVCEKMMQAQECDALGLIATAAHDLGKITKASADEAGNQTLKAGHAVESARLLALMPAWVELPKDEAELLRFAVKYSDAPTYLPLVERPSRASVLALMARMKSADMQATREEKAKVMSDAGNEEELALQAFLSALSQLPLKTKIDSDGVPYCGFRKGARLFITESIFREQVMRSYIDRDVFAAWELGYRKGGILHPFTAALLRGLDRRGWLVKDAHARNSHNDKDSKPIKAESAEAALWRLLVGHLNYKCMILIDLPNEERERLPPGEMPYAISVTGFVGISEAASTHARDEQLAEMKAAHMQVAAGRKTADTDAPVASVETAKVAETLFEGAKPIKRRTAEERKANQIAARAMTQRQQDIPGMGGPSMVVERAPGATPEPKASVGPKMGLAVVKKDLPDASAVAEKNARALNGSSGGAKPTQNLSALAGGKPRVEKSPPVTAAAKGTNDGTNDGEAGAASDAD